jgi:hypothetical protein
LKKWKTQVKGMDLKLKHPGGPPSPAAGIRREIPPLVEHRAKRSK